MKAPPDGGGAGSISNSSARNFSSRSRPPPQGPRPLGVVAAEVVVEVRLRRKARQLYDRPPRLIVEAISALVALIGDKARAEFILDSILAISDDNLAALGATDVPASLIRAVEG